jgi:hypothetical protein
MGQKNGHAIPGPQPMNPIKTEIREVLDELPDDCTMEDVQYHLYVREQIQQGLWSLENEPTYTQEEVEQAVAQWLTD